MHVEQAREVVSLIAKDEKALRELKAALETLDPPKAKADAKPVADKPAPKPVVSEKSSKQ